MSGDQSGVVPEKVLLRVDLFNATGKWGYTFEVEIDYKDLMWDHLKLLKQIDERQTEVLKGTLFQGWYVVLDDEPEERRNPTGRFFLKRLYSPDQIEQLLSADLFKRGKEVLGGRASKHQR
jgi:hypothetical protein